MRGLANLGTGFSNQKSQPRSLASLKVQMGLPRNGRHLEVVVKFRNGKGAFKQSETNPKLFLS
jgi:hypothetical protein